MGVSSPARRRHGFFGLVGDADGGELSGSEEADELEGVALVGLDAVPWPLGGEGGGDDLTRHAQGGELAVEVIARGSGLVAGQDWPLSLEALDESAECAGFIGDGAHQRLGVVRP